MSNKLKMMIIAHPEMAVGFNLAGVEVHTASNGAEAGSVIRDALMSSEYGVIGIDEMLNAQVDSGLKEEVEERGMPLLIPFPAMEIYTWEKVKREGDYAAGLIRNAIGYNIKLKR